MSKDLASVEREAPDIIQLPDEMGGWKMQAVDPVAELAKFEAAAQLQKVLLPASIKATLPADWIDEGGKAYLQATGVERLAPMWGLVFGRYTVEKEIHEDGSYSYIVRGPIMSRRTGVIYGEVIGGRSSSDPFFDEFDERRPTGWNDLTPGQRQTWKMAHRIPPDPLEVRKAAVTNWTTRGASMLMGMRGLTVAFVQENGITGISAVAFGSGGKGGDTAPADLKAARTELANEILTAVGGDVEGAKKLTKEITAGKNFAGFDSIERLNLDWQLKNAREKLHAHPLFGKGPKKAQREPGEEG
jgi:hypothetical protein